MLVKTYSSTVFGISATTITIEVNLGQGINFFLVGLPDSAVKESHQRIKAAFKNNNFNFIKIALVLLGFALFYYMFVLTTTINVFYFSSPYKSSFNPLISLTSYIPYLLLLIIIPLVRFNIKLIQEKYWNTFSIVILSLHSLLCLILIGFFVYWRFYFNF